MLRNETGTEISQKDQEASQKIDIETIFSMDVDALNKLSKNVASLLAQRDDQEITAFTLKLFQFNIAQCETRKEPKQAALIELDQKAVEFIYQMRPDLQLKIIIERMKIAHGGVLPEPGKPNFGAMKSEYPKSFVATMNNEQTTGTTNTTSADSSPAPVLSRSGSFGK